MNISPEWTGLQSSTIYQIKAYIMGFPTMYKAQYFFGPTYVTFFQSGSHIARSTRPIFILFVVLDSLGIGDNFKKP